MSQFNCLRRAKSRLEIVRRPIFSWPRTGSDGHSDASGAHDGTGGQVAPRPHSAGSPMGSVACRRHLFFEGRVSSRRRRLSCPRDASPATASTCAAVVSSSQAGRCRLRRSSSYRCVDLSANRPCARSQADRSAALGWERDPQPLAQCCPLLVVQRGHVSWGRCLSTQKGLPVVIEIPENTHSDRRHLALLVMTAYTKSGVIGRPSLGTAAKGRAALDQLAAGAQEILGNS